MTISIAWDNTGFYAGYMVEPGVRRTVFNPDTREVIATVLSYLDMLFIVSIIGVSITLLVKKIRSEYTESKAIQQSIRKLIITQIILGLLIAVGAFLVSIWGFPTSYNFILSDNQSLGLNFMPGPQFVTATLLSLITALLGVISLGFGITQYMKFRNRMNTSDVD